jgi:hypothetical protein
MSGEKVSDDSPLANPAPPDREDPTQRKEKEYEVQPKTASIYTPQVNNAIECFSTIVSFS